MGRFYFPPTVTVVIIHDAVLVLVPNVWVSSSAATSSLSLDLISNSADDVLRTTIIVVEKIPNLIMVVLDRFRCCWFFFSPLLLL